MSELYTLDGALDAIRELESNYLSSDPKVKISKTEFLEDANDIIRNLDPKVTPGQQTAFWSGTGQGNAYSADLANALTAQNSNGRAVSDTHYAAFLETAEKFNV